MLPYSSQPRPSPVRASARDRRTLIHRTQVGLVFLIFAVLLGWIPISIFGLASFLLGTIGAILVFLGAEAFRPRHRALVELSIGIFVVSFIAGVVAIGHYVSRIEFLFATGSGPDQADLVIREFHLMLLASLVFLTLTGVAWALIAFDLANQRGRRLMIGALLVQLAIAAFAFVFVFDPIVQRGVEQAFASGQVDSAPLLAAATQLEAASAVSLLNLIPAVLLAGAYRMTHHRIGLGFAGPTKPLKEIPSLWLRPRS